jgi:hypothetical protein
LICLSFACMRSHRVFRCNWKAPRRDLPQIKINWLLVFGWCRICLEAAPGVDF